MIVHEIKQERRSVTSNPLSVEEVTFNRAPNYKHKDGRIYASKSTVDYVAVSVSPYNEKFRTQIEDGVWDIVEVLCRKNYLPVSSCAGHNIWNSNLYFTVVFGDELSATKYSQMFSDIDGVTVKVLRTMANVKQVIGETKVSWTPLDEQEHSLYHEYKDLNRLFGRNYDEYWYVRVDLFANKPGWRNFFWNIKNEKNKKMKEELTKKVVIDRILSSDDYVG